MSKKLKIISTDLEKMIMAKVRNDQIKMKPKWYFLLGSLFLFIGIVGLSVGAVFLFSLTFFLLRKHGPMGQMRLEQILNSFPWWALLLAIVGMALGVFLFKKYDFSYKKNFKLIIIGFIVSVIFSGYVIDFFGLNEIWFKKGPFKRFYQQEEKVKGIFLNNGEIKNGLESKGCCRNSQ